MYFFKEINEIDYSNSTAQEIETEAFGEGAMNEWFLVPFIRYGAYVLMNSDGEVVASAEYMRFLKPQMAIYSLCP